MELKNCRSQVCLLISLCTLPKVIDVPLTGLLRWCSVWGQGREVLACSQRKCITLQHSFSRAWWSLCLLLGSVALTRNEILLTGGTSTSRKWWVLIVWVPTCFHLVDTPLKGCWRVQKSGRRCHPQSLLLITVNVTNVTCRGCYHFRWSETSLGTLWIIRTVARQGTPE